MIRGIFIAKLIVAEKPSVAMSYAKVLGATNRQDGYLEGNGYLVSWCYGRRARGRTDLPPCLPASRLQKAVFTPVAFQHGGNRYPGGVRPPQTVN